jgi:16S rRNA processing protein RimM
MSAAPTLIALAKVGRPYGLTGAMHVYPFSNDAATLKRTKTLLIGTREFTVRNIRDHGESLVMTLVDIDSPEMAQTLTNAEIKVDRSVFPALPDGEFYWIDLIGLACTNGDRLFGEITEVFEAGAHPILRVRPVNADEKTPDELIPFVDAIVRSVSLAERRVDVDWLGLD